MAQAISRSADVTSLNTESISASKPSYQAYQILHLGFTVAPIVAGLDKFFNLLVNWEQYLPAFVKNMTGGHGHELMLAVGVIEIVAGLVVAVTPRWGGLLVAAWLAGIILNLLIVGGYGDIALRDFGLMLGALTLARLATAVPAERPQSPVAPLIEPSR